MDADIRPEHAVRAAKNWLAQVLADEEIKAIALEEVRFREGNWEITLGFERGEPPALVALSGQRHRIYKVLVVAGNDNHVMEMRDREVA